MRGEDIRRISGLLLPVGLPAVLVLGLFVPYPGQAVSEVQVGPLSMSDVLVVPIFFLFGLQIRLSALGGRALPAAIAAVLAINLVLAPLLGAVVVRGLDLPFGIEVGVALMASVPATLSSAAVIAINTGGDRAWAVGLTVITVLVGAITAPLTISAVLSTDVELDALATLSDVVRLVLIPTALGYLARRIFNPTLPQVLDLLPSIMVLSVVWLTVSSNAETVWELDPRLIAAMVAVAAVIHGILLGTGMMASRRLTTAQAMPVIFVAAQKTLPLALTILAIISEQMESIAEVSAVAAITCVAWHFTQLISDSALARRLASAHQRRSASGSATAA